MGSINLPFARNAALTWGLWKVLDHLLLRYFPDWWPALRGAAPGGVGGVALPDVSAVMDSAEFAAACRELRDPGSPVMQALAALWAADTSAGATPEAAFDGLSLEQGLVVLSVLLQAAAHSD